MKDLSESDEYKKAYLRADRICRYMPQMVDKMASPKGEPLAQKQAFEDRVIDYRIEQDSMNNMPPKMLFKKYGSRLIKYNQRHSKDKGRGRD